MDRRLVWAVTFSLGVCAVTLQRSLLPWVILAGMGLVGIGLFLGPRLRLLPFLRSWPDGAPNANDRSCVLRIKGRYGSALLTGDVEMAAERNLLKHYGNGLKSDLLQIPHHGSKTSSTERFLTATRPHYAALSRGVLNRFNHPDKAVVGRYQEHGAQIGDTATDGQLSYHSLREGWEVGSFAEDWVRFWH